jgi:nitrite reductase/ring-hydroxylating ferredoxin subunit
MRHRQYCGCRWKARGAAGSRFTQRDIVLSSRLMTSTSPHSDTPLVVARVGELQPGQTKKFVLSVQGREVEAFLVNHDGTLYAYVNRCRHVPMTMDWIDNQFMTEDRRYIQCATHGACYEPATGECVSGPPFGQFLTPVPLTIAGDEVTAGCPDDC